MSSNEEYTELWDKGTPSCPVDLVSTSNSISMEVNVDLQEGPPEEDDMDLAPVPQDLMDDIPGMVEPPEEEEEDLAPFLEDPIADVPIILESLGEIDPYDTCELCNQDGHNCRYCPHPLGIVCPFCGLHGHGEARTNCPYNGGPGLIPCTTCEVLGHTAMTCPDNRFRFTGDAESSTED